MVVDRGAGGLHHKHVGAAHRFVDRHGDLPVAEGLDLRTAEVQAQPFRDLARQQRMGIGGKDLDVLAVEIHPFAPFAAGKTARADGALRRIPRAQAYKASVGIPPCPRALYGGCSFSLSSIMSKIPAVFKGFCKEMLDKPWKGKSSSV